MKQFFDLWSGLNLRRQIVVIGATLAMFAAVLGLARMAAAPNLTLLYSGLEGGPAGEVVRALEQRGMAYEVRGGAIFVEAGQRDELRMILASDGLPRTGGQGYELLDSLSGFGTTSQMFDAAYWRAKEGELARTIASSPQIQSARVHIARTADTPFRRKARPTASVFVTSGGGTLAPSQAKALRYLVASAVAGLAPDDVAIIDSSGELIGLAQEDRTGANNDDHAEALRSSVQRLLEARVGLGNAVVELSVETQTESESIRETRFDPENRVAISTDTEERSNSSRNANTGGEVTVASNLPDGAAGSGGDSSSQDSESRERVNYEVSQVEREVIKAPGAVRRMTVAALVNGLPVTGGDGTVQIEPRAADELAELRDLIASAVGFDAARGDVITIKSMAFQPVTSPGPMAAPGFLAGFTLDATRLIQVLVLGGVALILGLFVVRPVLRRQPEGLPQLAAPSGYGTAGAALDGEIDDDEYDLPDLPIVSGFGGGMDAIGESGGNSPVQRLRNIIGERQDETVEILRSWLDEKEERTG